VRAGNKQHQAISNNTGLFLLQKKKKKKKGCTAAAAVASVVAERVRRLLLEGPCGGPF